MGGTFMVIDSHFHLIPDLIPVEKMIQGMDAAGIDKIALIPDLSGAIKEPGPFIMSAFRYMLKNRQLRPVAKRLSARFTKSGDVKMPSGITKVNQDPSNQSVFDVIDQYPDRFYGWVFVNPNGENNPVDEYDKWSSHPGFIGIKTHPFWHRYSPSRLLPLAEKLAKKGTPMLLHLGFDDHGDISALTSELPELKLILAHAAFPKFSDTWEKIRENRNICVDFSATPYVDIQTMKSVAESLGVERCFFGTDGPYGSHDKKGNFDFGFIKRRIEAVFPDEGIQKLLLGENFMNFIGKEG